MSASKTRANPIFFILILLTEVNCFTGENEEKKRLFYLPKRLIPSLKEFRIKTTSLSAMTPAPQVGVSSPTAATGMAITL